MDGMRWLPWGSDLFGRIVAWSADVMWLVNQ